MFIEIEHDQEMNWWNWFITSDDNDLIQCGIGYSTEEKANEAVKDYLAGDPYNATQRHR